MHILITGGAGFIGSHLAKHYSEKGDQIYIVDNLLTGNKKNLEILNPKAFTFYKQDILDFDWSKLPKIDIAYHLASPASPIQYKRYPIETMRVNTEGTFMLLNFCRDQKCDRFVFTSTSEIYGDPLEHPQKETYWGNVNTLGERACYDEAKRFAETIIVNYHKKFNIDVRLARIFNTYGPNMEIDDGRVVSNFIVQGLKNLPFTIYGDGSQTRSFCYVSDMVLGLVKLGETNGISGEVINLGNPEEKSINELATLIKKATNSSAKITNVQIGGDDPKKRKPNIEKADQLLDWKPTVSLMEGLNKTIGYFKNILK